MAINFPISPNVNDTYTTDEGKVFTWNGTAWTTSTVVLTTASGSEGQVSYNNSGSIGYATELYYNDLSNKVGIGTSSPSTPLHVSDSGVPSIRIEDTDATSGYVDYAMNGNIAVTTVTGDGGNPGYYLELGTNAAQRWLDDGTIQFFNLGTEAVQIDSNGNVGIGTNLPSEKLDVNGTVKATGWSGGELTQTDWENGISTTETIVSPAKIKSAIEEIPKVLPGTANVPPATSTFAISGLTSNKTYYIDFSALRCSVATNTSFRFRASTDGGSTFLQSPLPISNTLDWNTNQLYGRLILRFFPNAISGVTPAIEFLTHTEFINGNVCTGVYPDTPFLNSSVNFVEFSWSSGNFQNTGAIFSVRETQA
jgi:hypothetical protein